MMRMSIIASACPSKNISWGLLEIGREAGKGGEIDRIVLHDKPRLPVLDDLLDAVDRGERFGARGVERRHAAELAIVPHVVEIAGQDHRTRLPQLNQQYLVPRRVPGRLEYADSPVAKHIVVAIDGLLLRS